MFKKQIAPLSVITNTATFGWTVFIACSFSSKVLYLRPFSEYCSNSSSASVIPEKFIPPSNPWIAPKILCLHLKLVGKLIPTSLAQALKLLPLTCILCNPLKDSIYVNNRQVIWQFHEIDIYNFCIYILAYHCEHLLWLHIHICIVDKWEQSINLDSLIIQCCQSILIEKFI